MKIRLNKNGVVRWNGPISSRATITTDTLLDAQESDRFDGYWMIQLEGNYLLLHCSYVIMTANGHSLTEDEQRIVIELIADPYAVSLDLWGRVHISQSTFGHCMTSIYKKYGISHVRGRKKRKELIRLLKEA